jgi:hypothetical protein
MYVCQYSSYSNSSFFDVRNEELNKRERHASTAKRWLLTLLLL